MTSGLAFSWIAFTGIIIIQFHYKYSVKILYFNIIPAEMDSLLSFWSACAFISFESSVLAFEKNVLKNVYCFASCGV